MKELLKKNVYWFLLDGLSPLFLKSCSKNKNLSKNFIDEILESSCVFSNVAATQGGTHTAMHSLFSSMLPSINGAAGWTLQALRNFNQEIFTITDFFNQCGYETFRWSDADSERVIPMSGVKIWESSGCQIEDTLKMDIFTKSVRRDSFIKIVKETKQPKFVYHHCFLLHELNGKMGRTWSSEQYIENIKLMAENFRSLLMEYDIKDDDVLIVSSDHGVILDKDFVKDAVDSGEKREEISIQTFFSVKHPSLPKKNISNLISSLDIAPTLIDLVLSEKMPGQGINRCSLIFKNEYEQRICFGEKGSYANVYQQSPLKSDVFNLRDGNWKYVYGINDSRCEWLMNLSKDEDYSNNLIFDYPELRAKYRLLLDDVMIHPKLSVNAIYKENNFKIKKQELPVFFSVIVNTHVDLDVLESLLDMPGPYYEIILLRNKSIPEFKNKSSYKVKIATKNNFVSYVGGQWCVFINKNNIYSEYFLSDIYKFIITINSDNMKIRFNSGYSIRYENVVSPRKIESVRVNSIRVFYASPTVKIFIKRFVARCCRFILAKFNFDYNSGPLTLLER